MWWGCIGSYTASSSQRLSRKQLADRADLEDHQDSSQS